MHSADLKSLFSLNKRQLRLLAGGVAAFAALGFLAPMTASANVSASLVDSLPSGMVQDFPLRDQPDAVNFVAATETRQPLPKQAPKLVYEVVRALGSQMTTAYTSSVEETDGNPNITASGSKTHWGTIADNSLPFGTLVKIEGFGDKVFRVEDRGGNAFDIDIWMPTKAKAYQHGRRSLLAW